MIDRTMVTSRLLDVEFSDLHRLVPLFSGGTDDVHGASPVIHGTAKT